MVECFYHKTPVRVNHFCVECRHRYHPGFTVVDFPTLRAIYAAGGDEKAGNTGGIIPILSRLVKKLDEDLKRFAKRRLEEPYPQLIIDARHEKVRESGMIRSQAVLIAIGIDWDDRPNRGSNFYQILF
jgi:hypothetical protein